MGRRAQLAIAPALANPNAQGYIDFHRPHSINHLIVDDLGTEEILLLATDSGNITAYYTKSIEEAIRRQPFRFTTSATGDLTDVRPFFSEWVYESAWGLSIHTRARMIAVSANTPHHIPKDDPCAKVTVFAFALSGGDYPAGPSLDGDDDYNDTDQYLEWHEWDVFDDIETPPRDKNYKITLAGLEGHDANIPSVAFVNTEQDLRGKWLISTDIDGNTKVWQIWRGLCHKDWNFAEKNIRAGWLRRREGGWAVAALDSRCFRTARSMEEFCGHSRAPSYHGHAGTESYDITNIVRLRTPGNSHAHPLMVENSDDSDDLADSEQAADFWSDSDDIIDDDTDGFPTYQLGSNPIEPIAFQNSQATNSSFVSSIPASSIGSDHTEDPAVLTMVEVHEDDSMSGEGDENQRESSSDELTEDLSSSDHRSITSLSSLAQQNQQVVEDDAVLLLPTSVSSIEVGSPRKGPVSSATTIPRPRTRRNSENPTVPDIPLLHCSASNLRMLRGPDAQSPHLFCANILKQALPPIIERGGLGNFERLNIIQQIPELGIVIVASQIGRCAVCSLTRNGKTGTLGLRVDWILPTRKQESKMLRPVRPLLGIATSPVQGRTSEQRKSQSPDADDSITWGSDGVLDGVSITFDPVMLGLKDRDHGSSENLGSSDEDEAESSSRGARRAKRKRLSPTGKGARPSQYSSEYRKWTIPAHAESWETTENSRRYRLMLTYSDFTVFTYELSRGVERDDMAQGEVSSLDLVD
ncbi:hypothetical protein LTR84_008124 [Exophiala bonariae]|uniref:Uncharacterized protein n=1 Tax=Exophiala bonariae TaxID=1690606 RepID=A0AAV9NQS7_9EURO|nr:hypothetical protein LTR84_008124 [Exophiala bonariae]